MRSVKTSLGVVDFDVEDLVLKHGQEKRPISTRKWYQGRLGDYEIVIQWYEGQGVDQEYKHVFLLGPGGGICTIGGGPLLKQAVEDIERLFGVRVKLSSS